MTPIQRECMNFPLYDTTVLARCAPWSRTVQLVICEMRAGEFKRVAKHIEMEDYQCDGRQISPTIDLGMHEAQQLMDQLWQCGLRPSEGSGSAGQLAATQKHLEDMRTISTKLLESKLK